jgi:hypothetical protein
MTMRVKRKREKKRIEEIKKDRGRGRKKVNERMIIIYDF